MDDYREGERPQGAGAGWKASIPNLMKPSLAVSEEVLTCGLSCLSALSALFAKLVAVAIVGGGRGDMEEGKQVGPHGYLRLQHSHW